MFHQAPQGSDVWPVTSMEVTSCRTQGDALRSLFLLGPVFSLSRWRRRLEEGQGRASESKSAAGDRQGPQAGATSTEEWTDRPTKSPERQGQDRAPVVQSDPPAGLSLYRSPTSSVPPPHPSPARPTCVSRRARCPFVPSAGIREGDLWGKRPGRQAEGALPTWTVCTWDLPSQRSQTGGWGWGWRPTTWLGGVGGAKPTTWPRAIFLNLPLIKTGMARRDQKRASVVTPTPQQMLPPSLCRQFRNSPWEISSFGGRQVCEAEGNAKVRTAVQLPPSPALPRGGTHKAPIQVEVT